jgi:hypothetical protein
MKRALRSARARALILACLALAGCTPASAPPPPPRPGPPPPPRVLPGSLDASKLLGDVSGRASHLGAGSFAIVASGEAVDGDRLGAFVDLPPDACVLVYARASSSIEDVDLAAFDDEGTLLAVDNGRDPKPTLLLCPPEPARAYIGASVVSGEGLIAIAAQTIPRDRADEIGRAFGAHGVLGGGSRPVDAWPGLDDHLRAHRRALGGAWEEIYSRGLLLDSRVPTVVSLPVEADQCVDAFVVLGDEVALVEIEAQDEAGRVVARAREGGTDRALTVCSPIAFRGSLVLRPHVGSGLAAIVLAKTRGSAARDLTTKPETIWEPGTVPLDAARAERSETLTRAGYGPAAFTANGALTVGHRTSIPLDLGGSASQPCTRIDVVAGAPLALVDAHVWSDKGELMSAAEGVAGTSLFACQRGKAQLDLEANGRSGPFAVMARPERWRDPAFAAHPLAASRMLARAAEGGARILEGVPVSVRAATLDEGKLLAWTETVPPWGCVHATAGAQGEGTGLELRVFDTASGEELDRSHAEHAVGVRACAPERRVPDVRFELRVTSGKLDVVVGERVR